MAKVKYGYSDDAFIHAESAFLSVNLISYSNMQALNVVMQLARY
jgi:hypothetical protein